MRKITLLLLSLVFTAIAYASPGTDTWGYSSQNMSLQQLNSKLESDFQNCKYFAVWGFGQNSYVSRVVIEYENEPVGIEGVEGHEGDCRMFDINGIEVNPDSKLAPGIYVRVSGGKASKIAVK